MAALFSRGAAKRWRIALFERRRTAVYDAASSITVRKCGLELNVRPRRRCRGASTLEFAIVAPIMFLTIFGLIQFAGLLLSQNALTNAAREGARAASLPGTTSSESVVSVVEKYQEIGGIDPSAVEVSVTLSSLSAVETGDELRVTVSAPMVWRTKCSRARWSCDGRSDAAAGRNHSWVATHENQKREST